MTKSNNPYVAELLTPAHNFDTFELLPLAEALPHGHSGFVFSNVINPTAEGDLRIYADARVFNDSLYWMAAEMADGQVTRVTRINDGRHNGYVAHQEGYDITSREQLNAHFIRGSYDGSASLPVIKWAGNSAQWEHVRTQVELEYGIEIKDSPTESRHPIIGTKLKLR